MARGSLAVVMRLLPLALLALLVPAVLSAQTAETARFGSEEALRRYARGRLLEEQGLKTEALEEYYRALVLDPRAIEIARRVSEVAAQMGDPGRSLEFAERALSIRPEDPRALWLKGAAFLNLGRDPEALAPLAAAAEADSDRVEYLRTLAHAAERLDRFDLLVRCYRRVVWLDDEDGEAWFQLAAAETRLGRFGAAETALAAAVELNPLRPGLFFLQGWIAESLGRLEEGRRHYRQHLRIHPDDRTTRRRLILLLAREKRFVEAAREARVLAGARPEDLEARHLEAELHFQAGKAGEGMRLLEKLEKDQPGSVDALSVRVGILARHGRERLAVAEAEQWLKQHPEDLRALLLAARAREMSGAPEHAVAHLRRAMEVAPDSLAPHVMLARAHESAGHLDEAEKTWSEAASRFPDLDGLAFDLAICREKLGDIVGAEKAVRDVLSREPENAMALNFLGYLFADHNRNLEESVDLIQRALHFDPNNGAYLDSLGWAYYRLGRLGEARSHLERAVTLSGGDPVIHEHLGDVYKDLRLNDLARDQYRRSLSFDPSNDRVRNKLSRIR